MTSQCIEEKSLQPWFLYVLETKHKHFYTGITTQWRRRFKEHSSNTVKSAKALRGKGPLTLRYCVQVPSHSIALQAEYWLKKQGKNKKTSIVEHSIPLPYPHTLVDFSNMAE